MNFVYRNIPNVITCLNLLCGSIGVILVLSNRVEEGASMVFFAAFFDFLDGFAARTLKVESPIGKDLDSLADMVSFGLLPGILVYVFLRNSLVLDEQLNYGGGETAMRSYLPYTALLIPVFSAIRLARFNNDIRQSENFIGLPTPANAIFIASLALNIHVCFRALKSGVGINSYDTAFLNLLHAPYFWTVLSIVCSFLLIAPLPLFSLKFKTFAFSGNGIRYIFLTIALILLITLKLAGLPLIIILYLFLSSLSNIFTGRKD